MIREKFSNLTTMLFNNEKDKFNHVLGQTRLTMFISVLAGNKLSSFLCFGIPVSHRIFAATTLSKTAVLYYYFALLCCPINYTISLSYTYAAITLAFS